MLAALPTYRLTDAWAQCPDGTPPPCGRTAARTTAAAPENSVAVLYFENASRDSGDAYLADGLTEEIISRLSGITRLTVRSKLLVRRYRGGQPGDPAAVGRSLNVRYLVTGSVRRSGDRLRVSAELVNANGGAQVWGRQFDQAAGDVFAIQETVSREVATGIVGRLVPTEQQALAARPTRNPAAYDAMLRGNFQIARRDSAGLTRAIREYETALRADPEYVDALARLAWVYGIAAGNGVNLGIPDDSAAALAVRYADEAVRRAPNSSDAWISLDLARFAAYPRTLDGMLEAARRAVVLNPASAEAVHQLSFALSLADSMDAAAAWSARALELDPARPITLANRAQYVVARDGWAAGLPWADSALAVDPDFVSARVMRFVALLMLGHRDSARAELVRWHTPGLRRMAPLAEGALALAPGDSAAMSAWRTAATAQLPGTMTPTTAALLSSSLLAASGDREIVLIILERARPRGAQLRAYMIRDRIYAPLRNDPRFQRVVAESSP